MAKTILNTNESKTRFFMAAFQVMKPGIEKATGKPVVDVPITVAEFMPESVEEAFLMLLGEAPRILGQTAFERATGMPAGIQMSSHQPDGVIGALGVLAHEMIHLALQYGKINDDGDEHGPDFAKAAESIGLAPPWGATQLTKKFLDWMDGLGMRTDPRMAEFMDAEAASKAKAPEPEHALA